jgi:hypothetical protein
MELVGAERHPEYVQAAEHHRLIARARRAAELGGLPTGLQRVGGIVEQIWAAVRPTATRHGGATVVAPWSTAIGF